MEGLPGAVLTIAYRQAVPLQYCAHMAVNLSFPWSTSWWNTA